jgi:YbbR domain-containing protein
VDEKQLERRPKTAKGAWIGFITENGSYKLVALFVTLILWVTILGRRDFVLSKDVDLEFLLPRHMVIAENINRQVDVKVSGPRMALKKFAQNPGTIVIDLGQSHLGPNRAVISPKNVEVPFGVKVLAVTPDVINITLVKSGQDTDSRE